MDKTALYLGYFIVYSVIMLIIGKSSLRGANTPQDYFICGKKVSLKDKLGTALSDPKSKIILVMGIIIVVLLILLIVT